jgi:hypothetical protein
MAPDYGNSSLASSTIDMVIGYPYIIRHLILSLDALGTEEVLQRLLLLTICMC